MVNKTMKVHWLNGAKASDKKPGYVKIYHSLINFANDGLINHRDVGIYASIQAFNPKYWHYSLRGLEAKLNLPKSVIHRSIQRLEQAKFIKVVKFRDCLGHFDCGYVFYQEPTTDDKTDWEAYFKNLKNEALANEKNFSNQSHSTTYGKSGRQYKNKEENKNNKNIYKESPKVDEDKEDIISENNILEKTINNLQETTNILQEPQELLVPPNSANPPTVSADLDTLEIPSASSIEGKKQPEDIVKQHILKGNDTKASDETKPNKKGNGKNKGGKNKGGRKTGDKPKVSDIKDGATKSADMQTPEEYAKAKWEKAVEKEKQRQTEREVKETFIMNHVNGVLSGKDYDTNALKGAFNQYIRVRLQKSGYYTIAQFDFQLEKLESMTNKNVGKMLAILNDAIEGGWGKFYLPKENNYNTVTETPKVEAPKVEEPEEPKDSRENYTDEEWQQLIEENRKQVFAEMSKQLYGK